MPTPADFFRRVTLTDVTLRVGDLAGVAAFYRDVLGLHPLTDEPGRVALAAKATTPSLLSLVSAPTAPRRLPGTAGLFHVALLHPNRSSLAAAMVRVQQHGVPCGGADHGVSEAIYLQDPEGNGIELYADRAPETWPRRTAPDRVAMNTAPLDVASLLAAAAVPGAPPTDAVLRVGHIHLSVSRLDAARDFYAGVLGFPVRQDDYPGALFFGRDGYHHHLATNTWRSQRAAPAGARGMARFTIGWARDADWREVTARARAVGAIAAEVDGEIVVRDPDGIEIALRLDGSR